jgi:transposase
MLVEKRQPSTAEFTHEAVGLVTVHGYGGTQAARHVGLTATRRGRWQRAPEAREDRAFPGKGRVSPEQDALHGLRAEHKRLRMERER